MGRRNPNHLPTFFPIVRVWDLEFGNCCNAYMVSGPSSWILAQNSLGQRCGSKEQCRGHPLGSLRLRIPIAPLESLRNS